MAPDSPRATVSDHTSDSATVAAIENAVPDLDTAFNVVMGTDAVGAPTICYSVRFYQNN